MNGARVHFNSSHAETYANGPFFSFVYFNARAHTAAATLDGLRTASAFAAACSVTPDVQRSSINKILQP
jgi:hypothetical protein